MLGRVVLAAGLGAHQLYDRDGAWTLVDHIFDGWPYYPREPAPDGSAPAATFVFRQGPGDDLVVGELAPLRLGANSVKDVFVVR